MNIIWSILRLYFVYNVCFSLHFEPYICDPDSDILVPHACKIQDINRMRMRKKSR